MSANEFYGVVSKEFYDTPDNLPVSGLYLNHVKRLVPRSWRIQVRGWWTFITPADHKMAKQGFKIHISAINKDAVSIINAVLPILVTHQVAFKFVSGPEMYTLGVSKNFGRSGSAKLIAVYPTNEEVFRKVIEDLYQATKDFQGPYILSDMRYKDSGVVYYRYGGFISVEKLKINGTAEAMIQDADGSYVSDERVPYYKLPEWVTEPFQKVNDISTLSVPLLNDRYQVLNVMKFSNSGGVYLAKDLSNDEDVVIKEARPHIGLARVSEDRYIDSKELLKREALVLRKLEKLDCAPRFIDEFEQESHAYLVQSFIPGQPLSSFRARDNVTLISKTDREGVIDFIMTFSVLARRTIDMVKKVHSEQVILGDLSASNVMVEPESLTVRLIDFETSWDCEQGEPDYIVTDWGTDGYRHRVKRQSSDDIKSDLLKSDWYSLAMTLYSTLLPNNNLFELAPDKFELMLTKLTEYYGLPDSLKGFLKALKQANLDSAMSQLNELEGVSAKAVLPVESWQGINNINTAKSIDRAAVNSERLADYVESVATPLREDRLWPSGAEIFVTKPGSLAYGAAGTQMFLADMHRECQAKYNLWWQREWKHFESYPPGFHSGLAGISYLYGNIGQLDTAKVLFEQLSKSSLRFANNNWMYGEAGIAHAGLALFAQSKDEEFLYHAKQSGEHLLKSAENHEGALCWLDSNGKPLHPGFADGVSGIILALTQLYEVTTEQKYIDSALQALSYVNQYADVSLGRPVWYLDQTRQIHTPYWYRGAAGIGSVLLRMGSVIDDQGLIDLGCEAIGGAFSKFTVACDQYRGMSGIGESLLDAYQITADERFLRMACLVADTISLYIIEQDEGAVIPGFQNKRFQCDYAHGTAGVGCFLKRLTTQSARRFMDIQMSR
ncbi:class III lanthionine synthetase LanKC [uncultured Idiomarina sp.]|uniref:class III lanthionine synthetase LanKC n=1 Tax=uncultured Idiomarina sp. TaxID=352961 RepID=UPI0025972D2D|nr:class III lanthionine synthetase LanKC [uncultured Idiomarina sp.]